MKGTRGMSQTKSEVRGMKSLDENVMKELHQAKIM